MNWRRLALKVGITAVLPGKVDDLELATVQSMNSWAHGFEMQDNLPFPFIDSPLPRRQLGRGWSIEIKGWVLGLPPRRQCWLKHDSGISSRWVDGNVNPEPPDKA